MFALSRSGYLPAKWSELHPRFRTPHWALLVGGIAGLVALLTGTTAQVILISALGALVMYLISMLSLFKLRQQAVYIASYKTPYYPVFPVIAMLLSLICLASIVYFNPLLSLIFLAGMVAVVIGFKLVGNVEKTALLRSEDIDKV